MLGHKGIAEDAAVVMLLNKFVNARGTKYTGMDLEHGLCIKESLYVCHMKVS